MEVDRYVYTLGIDGETFMQGLKQGKIIGRKCPKCGRVYVPPRMYCEDCFIENKDYIEVHEPYLDSYTVIHYDNRGARLEPLTIGLVRFKGVSGGLLALVDGKPEIGRKVEIESFDIPLRVKVV
ncbi:Zn-ribbon domain-containing OB-fold protein [Metallosphaera hakonensis]|uniref:DNA-binding protein n=1 Tax=Metallosphaera hakonensis JCM 8857 = DSM 7519 TaxID=1293036 RepID=A0A2U9IT57_9CREN|nr:Zn-ribbon domain-containing OB-fold protein [Metallosphaera hakonensis]AWR99239.1 DNA-binding protein [Metallosphaera hakonensis JCM 8857 = DSM 7519]